MGKSLPSGSGPGSGPRATNTSRPRSPSGRSTRRSSRTTAGRCGRGIVHSTPRHSTASNAPDRSGRASAAATTVGRPNSRRPAAAAPRIGSTHTGCGPKWSASQAAGPPTPEPTSATRVSGPISSASASQARSDGLPLPRQPAGIAYSGPSSRTASSVQPASRSNSISWASSPSVSSAGRSTLVGARSAHVRVDGRRADPRTSCVSSTPPAPRPDLLRDRGLDLRARHLAAPRRQPGQVDAHDSRDREQRPRLVDRRRDPRRHRVRCGEHGLDRGVVEVQPREGLQDAGRALVGVDRDARDERQRRPGLPGLGDEAGDRRRAARVVQHAQPGPGALLARHPRGPQRPRRGLGRLRDGRDQPRGGGEGGEPGAVEVEDLGDVGTHARRADVAGRAQHALDPDRGEPHDLLLQHDPVAVAAGQRGPRAATRGEHLGGEEGRRQVRCALVLADEQRVRRRRRAPRRPGAPRPARRA